MAKAKFERPQGEWIRNRVAFYQGCSECGANIRSNPCEIYLYPGEINFCPSCGADMRKPNCVTCDHFGNCEGCEKGEEE